MNGKRKILALVSVVIMLAILGSVMLTGSAATNDGNTRGFSNLTDEQKDTIKQIIQDAEFSY